MVILLARFTRKGMRVDWQVGSTMKAKLQELSDHIRPWSEIRVLIFKMDIDILKDYCAFMLPGAIPKVTW